jgi:hypothetical protein
VKDRWIAPISDTIGAAIGGVNMAIAASTKSYEDLRYVGIKVDKSVGFWGLGVVPLVLFGAGAVYGYVQCARCDALLREQGLDTQGEKVVRVRVETEAQREQRWANPEDWGNTGKTAIKLRLAREGDGATVLPDWSAFQRVPLEPLDAEETSGAAPAKTIPAGGQP